jgi:hypothetical protein
MKLLAAELDECVRENEMLHAENALKLTQILDLEQLLYGLRLEFFGSDKRDEDANGPCWCGEWDEDGGLWYPSIHIEKCEKARQATEHLWKV